METKICAFTGIDSNDRATVIQKIYEYFSTDYQVVVFSQTASMFRELHKSGGITKAELFDIIAEQERTRLISLDIIKSTKVFDLVLVDGTCFDILAYINYYRKKGILYNPKVYAKDVYDQVFLLKYQINNYATLAEQFAMQDLSIDIELQIKIAVSNMVVLGHDCEDGDHIREKIQSLLDARDNC